MNRSTKIRYIIFQILAEVFKKNRNFELVFNKMINEFNFTKKEITFINNVCLNSMRKSIHCRLILNKFIKKKLKTNEFILLSCAIVQIIYLHIKPYAVINETVNVAKKVSVYSGLINAILKNILDNIDSVKNIKVSLKDFPKWFIAELDKTKNVDYNSFFDTFHKQPSLHLVFKSEKCIDNFNEPHTKSTNKSAFLDVQKTIKDIENYKKGEWWVQDFSAMIPLAINSKIKNNEILDICAAPGGKAFQVLSKNNIVLNDINNKRILKLKDNLSRLGFSAKIKNVNGLNFSEDKKFDIVLLDSPCSSVGTIRRHPEILFKSKEPNLKDLNILQTNLLKKSSKLVKNRGKIIYMVCSFFYSETVEIIKNFLKENKNFSIEKYNPNNKLFDIEKLISNEGYFFTLPTSYKKYYIDGFFSVQLIRND